MNLFPHNKEAYESAVSLFKRESRVCIIRPTGTGKSVIIAAFVNHHPAKRHLLLAPGSHIFNEIQKHIRTGKIATSTYIGLKQKKALFEPGSFDYIYLDEFHRLGAEVWGGAVERLLKLNPDAKVLGTSATPIRYLDDNRNMASEIFNDCIATQMSLNLAIIKGILPEPIYVSALYSVREEFQQMKGKILSSDSADKKNLIRDLDSKVIDWERSSGLDSIIKKHLDVERRRVIVFCKDWDHLKHAKKILNPIFQTIYGQVESLSLYSKNKGSENKSALKLFTGEDKRSVILYTIDKVNEGLHAKNCNTVILLRDTISPIVFYQQIGRAFSVRAANRPLIIDLVNNFKNIQLASFKNDFEQEFNSSAKDDQTPDEKRVKAAIEFIDETQDIRLVFSTFEEEVDAWKLCYEKAKACFEEHGHLRASSADKELLEWIRKQRKAYQSGKLEITRAEQLRAIGVELDPPIDAWYSFYEKAKIYFKEYGHLHVPPTHKELYAWIRQQRRRYRNKYMKEEKITLLKGIGMEFEHEIPARWTAMMHELEEWVEKNGEIPPITNKSLLGSWLSRQRQAFEKGTLAKSQIDMLKKFVPIEEDKRIVNIKARVYRLKEHFKNGNVTSADDIIKDDLKRIQFLYQKKKLAESILTDLRNAHVPIEGTYRDLIWFEKAKQVVAWYESTGNPPKINEKLYSFCMWERKNLSRTPPYLKFIKRDQDAGRLYQKYIKIISMMGLRDWDEQCLALKRIATRYGHVSGKNCDIKVLQWMYTQRHSLRNNKLSPEKVEKLLAIKEVDWYNIPKVNKPVKTT